MFFRTEIEKKTKITACIIGALVLFIVLFSSFYIAVEADHDCSGDNCSICACIEQCETALRNLAGYGAAVLITVSAVLFLIRTIVSLRVFLLKKTPVSMRVRLNN